jgi:hypothetical protein
MNRNKSQMSLCSYSQPARLSVACSVLVLTPNCATPRFDPERNQALTFDAIAQADASVGPPLSRNVSIKSSPSQLGTHENEIKSPAELADSGTQLEPITCTVDPPDPKPLHTRDWVEYEFIYAKGSAAVRSQRRVQTAKPGDTARVVGRYAVELWIGCELIDRVRFNFPLQAAEQLIAPGTPQGLNKQPSFTANATLIRMVMVPLDSRATRAELVDRGTGKRSSLAWPPDLPPSSPLGPRNSPQIPFSTVPAQGSQRGQ